MKTDKKPITKAIKIIFFCLAALILLQFIPVPWKKTKDKSWFANETPLVIAHRGGRANWPENTAIAFSEAVAAGVDILEMDLQLTRDGRLVSCHDNGQGNRGISRTAFAPEGVDTGRDIIEFSLEELNSISFAMDHVFHMRSGFEQMIPSDIMDHRYEAIYENWLSYTQTDTEGIGTLSDVRAAFNPEDCFNIDDPASPKRIAAARLEEDIFRKFKDTEILFLIEIKQSGETGKKAVDVLINLAVKYSLSDRILIQTFHNDITDYISQIDTAGAKTGPGLSTTTKIILTMLSGTDFFLKTGFAVLSLPAGRNIEGGDVSPLPLDRRFFIRKAHRHNLPVYYWTVNHPDDIRHLRALGADGIITDDPLLMLELLDS